MRDGSRSLALDELGVSTADERPRERWRTTFADRPRARALRRLRAPRSASSTAGAVRCSGIARDSGR